MSVGIDPGDPRGWGLSFVDDEGRVVPPPQPLSFADVADWGRPRGPSMAEIDRVLNRYGRDPEAAQRLYERGLMPPEDVRVLHDFEAEAERQSDHLRRRLYETAFPPPDRAEAQRMIAEAYDLPEEVLGIRPEHDELIRSTRAEFPPDPYAYGRIYPGDAGTSRWTPPEDPDEKIRSCP